MFSPLSAYRVIFYYWVILLSPQFLYSQIQVNYKNNVEKDSIFFNRSMTTNLIDSNFINALPLRTTNDFLKYLPGVIEHQGKFHINGSRFDEVDYSLDGLSILNHFSGEQLIDIPKFALKSIGVENSNTINYQLRTGSNEFKYSLEHSTDNIGINSTSDFYKGQHRLGSYWYGYNET
ncbi:MAG: Plug domain-containing protein, partial [Melioribacteraceae bacterium]|nr:Plug domain-containing protein [Melioribacteraceae bacterium]